MLDFVMIFLIATHGWLNGKILKNELFASFDLFVLCAVISTEVLLFFHGRVWLCSGLIVTSVLSCRRPCMRHDLATQSEGSSKEDEATLGYFTQDSEDEDKFHPLGSA